ncbi:C40 family peptidase [Salinisphaera sp. LB1]|uniref:C40 family peptidase n=1 Tax=Salinisphaera sp. LB1 TaxID=2183911 RepID=UPI000D7D315C|nr:NlpC/P60 family protein [Salinisphaera sp. LB1]AWN15185.1 putative lipoprotein nlpC precursor [Salinisphaera sp. LB1]
MALAQRAATPPRLRSYRLLIIVAVALAAGGCASQGLQRGHSDLSRAGGGSKYRDKSESAESDLGMRAGATARLDAALHRVYERWAGTPYRYGGQSRNGVDCSSFVRQTVDRVESYELPRTAVAQAQVGMSVPRRNLKAGDLVFFKTGAVSHHVGIYLGRGRFMHASSSQGVTISRLDNVYWRNHYWQARRIPGNRQM